ncbi:MAG: valine--tRNA ligase [Filifactoraceae bacterium]
MANLAKNYDPKEFERRIYTMWEEKGFFEGNPVEGKEAYTIMLPPPNITGQLHMGHALDHTLQDILIRHKRMAGYNVLWQPGTDHASIATEVKVVQRIFEQEGLTKDQIGREEFLKRAWAWREEFGGRIVDQMKKLGDSCDWGKERFTMDEGCNQAVTEFFIKLYEDGHIYRGNRIINWCPDCKTSLSDAEVEHEEVEGIFFHFYYIIKETGEKLEVATTRPETILGDTAVAVNPNDERYAHLIGKTVTVPFVDREIKIIADDYVDIEFGTGVVKITPCHDPNDFEVGLRHGLEQIRVMNDDGSMNELSGKYQGLGRYQCRKAIMEDMEAMGLVATVKPHAHNVGHCYRCNNVIEPITSKQWFVKMDELAQPAIKALEDKDFELVPNRFDKTYYNWLNNIRDWCISRQLWWGHRIPAYYCQECDELMVGKAAPSKCPKCGGTKIVQDEDVLDTWFSSALWPFSTLGWPENTDLLKQFYPTSTLVTGYDIIFFWVIRMVFAALYATGEVPFKHVLIHGLVRDGQGRKMSKSLGNGIDPLEIIEQYGADALRFTLATGNSPGNDMRFYMERVESSRNFANKIWNASRFILMNLEDYPRKSFDRKEVEAGFELSDKWILSRCNEVIKEIQDNIDKFELGVAADKIYDFAWSEFCDWYIEMVKTRLYGEESLSKDAALYTLMYVLNNILKLLHPFMPFITEEIYGTINEGKHLIVAQWPQYKVEDKFELEEKQMTLVMETIRAIRNARADMNVPPSKKAMAMFVAEGEVKEAIKVAESYYISLASVSKLEFITEAKVPENAVSLISSGAKIYLPLAELIDFDKERERLNKEKDKLQGEIKRAEGKLANQGFVAKAPESLIEEEKAKIFKFKEMLEAVEERLSSLAASIK